jgi:hypothetical protein
MTCMVVVGPPKILLHFSPYQFLKYLGNDACGDLHVRMERINDDQELVDRD